MDFGIRELLMFVGALIFIGVLVDGVRRFQQNRRTQVKVKIDRKAQAELGDDDEDIVVYRAELPNGGARVVNKQVAGQGESSDSKKIPPRFSEPLDILMEGMTKRTVRDVQDDNFENDDGEVSISASKDEISWDEEEPFLEKDSEVDDGFDTEDEENKQQTTSHVNQEKSKHNQRDLFSAAADELDKDNDQSYKVSPQVSASKPKDLPEEVLAINVMAKGDSEFSGEELLEAILAFGLRYGEMNIFHRHEQSNGQGPVIFSMANALNPGTFDLETIPEANFKGVTFFMRLSQLNKRIFVLELMLDIAKRLATQLDAELKDDTRSVLSSQTVTHYKSRIQEYERRYLGQVLRS